MAASELPEPACVSGYTSAQVLLILGTQERVADLHNWMGSHGISAATCVGEVRSGPHGSVVPQAVLARYFARRQP